MKQCKPVPAKITRPRLKKICERERLYRRIDASLQAQRIWISGPGGGGKTTLVASYLDSRKLPCLWYQVDEGDRDLSSFFHYMGQAVCTVSPSRKRPLPHLTPEYLPALPLFTRRFFEEAFSRLKTPSVLVLDNYQTVPQDSGFHEMIVQALETVPDGITVMILSRLTPPPQFARLQANSRINVIGWEEIRFTIDESRNLIEKQGHNIPSSEVLDVIWQKAEGWAAGLILMMAARGATVPVSAPDEMSTGGLFDYFASEVFDKADASTQNLLLNTSFLRKIDPIIAERLSGNSASGRILDRLSRDHYFTQQYGQMYEYHPLFRDFLQSRAQLIFPKATLNTILQKSAELLEGSGQVEEASALFFAASDWSGLERILVRQAPTLLTQGRIQTIEGWLRSFPTEYSENSPWIQYWVGACRVSFNPAESRPFFEKSFELFRVRSDAPGIFLAWSGVVDSIFLAWGDFSPADRWIGMLDDLKSAFPQPIPQNIDTRVVTSMLVALTLRQPTHPDISDWVERARAVVYSDETNATSRGMLSVYLGLYYLWIGDHVGMEIMIRGVRESLSSPDASPLSQILGRLMEATYQVRMGRYDLCLEAVTEGERIAGVSGVVIWNTQLYSQGAMNALSEGRLAEACGYLQKMESGLRESRRIDSCMFHYSTAWHALLSREISRALRHAETSLRYAQEAGSPFHEAIARLAFAQALHEQGERRNATEQIGMVQETGRRMKSLILDFMVFINRAHFALDLGNEVEANKALRKAMAIGREQGYSNFYWWRSDVMSRLCTKALDSGIETEYVRDLIRKREISPALPPLDVENWPWRFDVATLGGFSLLLNSAPLGFTGRSPDKPLELLKAIIAFGGRGVAAHTVTDALWPESEGDVARRSFDTNLHRLRKLIGDEKAILMAEGKLTLSPALWRVDAWTFEHLFSKIEKLTRETEGKNQKPNKSGESLEESAVLIQKALKIYRGHFLPDDSDRRWSTTARNRLATMFLRFIVLIGTYSERHGKWEEAREYYMAGLEIDNSAEDLYQRLMFTCVRLGRISEAISTYNRCRATLESLYGVSPSSRTEEIYAFIKKEDPKV